MLLSLAQINLSGHQWLFSIQPSPSLMPALCLRHDVDGLVWQPRNVVSEGDGVSFRMEHVATFNAFGYVQASKQDRKFEVLVLRISWLLGSKLKCALFNMWSFDETF